MKVYPLRSLSFLWASLMLVVISSSLSADTFGLFTYEVVGGVTVTITDYPEDATGDVVIPAEIAGLPVTSIGDSAFYYCINLTSVTIPSSVSNIGDIAFFSCSNLTSVSIPSGINSIGSRAFDRCGSMTNYIVQQGNANYASVDGVLFNITQTTLIQYPAGRTGAYIVPNNTTDIGEFSFAVCRQLTGISIPHSIISIGKSAFSYCGNITNVAIPSSVTSIGSSAFAYCDNLISIIVEQGNVNYTSLDGVLFNISQTTLIQYPIGKSGAYIVPHGVTTIGSYAFFKCVGLTRIVFPSTLTAMGGRTMGACSGMVEAYFLGDAPTNSTIFTHEAEGFHVYYLSSKSGYSSPSWGGGASVMIAESVFPAASWLLPHGHDYNTNINQDLNSDGVTLLMAYALDLNPNERLTTQLPQAKLNTNTLSLQYYTGAAGVTYRVETSKDMVTWVTTDVTVSDPDGDGIVTASISRDEVCGFLRLVVIEE